MVVQMWDILSCLSRMLKKIEKEQILKLGACVSAVLSSSLDCSLVSAGDAVHLMLTYPTYFHLKAEQLVFFVVIKCVPVDCRHGAPNYGNTPYPENAKSKATWMKGPSPVLLHTVP
jgi:hypothetical protein